MPTLPDVGNADAITALDALEAAVSQAQLLIATLRANLQGLTPTQDIVIRWKRRYRELYGRDYLLTRADGGNLKRLVGEIGPDELKRRLGRFLKDTGRWPTERRHSLSVFFADINKYATVTSTPLPPPAEAPAAPVGCRHAPPCPSDAVHTQKKLAEIHG